MPRAIGALEAAFRDWAHGRATNQPRQRVHTSQGTLHLMGAAWHSKGYIGYKAYFSFPTGVRFHVVLASAHTGELLGADRGGLAGADSHRRGVGAGDEVSRPRGRIDSRDTWARARRRRRNCRQCAPCAPSSERLYTAARPKRAPPSPNARPPISNIPVQPAESVEQAVGEADVICTITSAREPIVQGAWLKPGMHLNAAGANSLARRELDTFAVGRCERIFVDDPAQARVEAAELIVPIELRKLSWERVHPLAHLVGGLLPPRQSPEEITLFKSLGIALEDVAAAAVVYEAMHALNLRQTRASIRSETDAADAV
jgi:alanine dehydrogenase